MDTTMIATRTFFYGIASTLGEIACPEALAWLTPGCIEGAFADSAGRIVVLNSNGAVKKYAVIEEAFRANIDNPIVRVDLATEQTPPDALKERLNSTGADLIFAIGSSAYQWAYRNAQQPVVFSSVLNWRRQRLRDDAYGIANELPLGMPLSMFRYLFPELKSVGVLYSETFHKEWVAEATAAAADVHIELVGAKIDSSSDIGDALSKLLPRVDALWLISDPIVLDNEQAATELFKQCDARRKPVFAYDDVYMKLGAVLAITADSSTMGIQAAKLAEDVLSASNTIAERVESPAGSSITLNLGRLQHYSITLNRQALGSVNRVIE